MQSADHVDFGDAFVDALPHGFDNLGNGQLESMSLPFFCTKRAELAREKADIRVVNVSVVNVGRDVSVFAFADNVCYGAHSVEVWRLVKDGAIGIRNAQPINHLIKDWMQFVGN